LLVACCLWLGARGLGLGARGLVRTLGEHAPWLETDAEQASEGNVSEKCVKP
jgi:hypothetical protein